MLVLSRKPEQKIQIGDNITITVLRLRGGTVQIGIEAPRSTPVVRGELEPLAQRDLQQNPDAEADAPSERQSQPAQRSRRPLTAGGEPSRTSSRLRSLRSWNPGERTGMGNQPLGARLHARRVPSACTATLSG